MARIFSATFTPYTYEQYAAPVREATAYHQKIQDQYDTALLEAYKLNSMLDQQNDPESWKLYNDTVKTIYDMANYLNTKGLDANSQTNLMRVRMQSQNIFDINAAINRKQEAIKSFMNSANGQNPRYIGIRPEETSVDDWRGGKTPDLFGVNGEQVYTYVKNTIENVSKQIYNEHSKGGYRITEIGVNPLYRQQVFNAIMDENYDGNYNFTGNSEQNNYMNHLVGEIRNTLAQTQYTFGYDQFKSDDNKKRFDVEMLNGVQNGIQYERKSATDPYALEAYKTRQNINEYVTKKYYDALFKGMTSGEAPTSFGEHFNYLKQNGEYDNIKSQLLTMGGIDIDKGSISGGIIWDENGKLREEFKNPIVKNKDGRYVHPQNNNFFTAYEYYVKPLEDYIKSQELAASDRSGYTVGEPKPALYANYSDSELYELYNEYQQRGYTKDTYDMLKRFNINNLNTYNDGQGFNAQDALSLANKELQKYNVTTFGLTDDSQVGKIILRGWDTDKKIVSKIEGNGDRGSLISSKNVPFLKKNSNGKYEFDKEVVNGYAYDINHPDEFIVIASGKQYAVPLSIFSDEIQKGIMDQAQEYKALNNGTITNQDAVAKILYDYFLTGNLPVYGNTIKRD